MVEIILLISIIITIFLTRLFEKRGLISPTLSRKALHVVAIGLSALVPLLSSNIEMVKWIVGLSMPITFILVSKEFFPRDESGRKSWGIFYYSVVFFCLMSFFPYQPQMVYYPLMVMALADGLATVVGKKFGKPIRGMEGYPKTIAGSLTFFALCASVLFFSPFMDSSLGHLLPIGPVILISAFLAAVEFITKDGRDNIWVPVAVVYWLDTGRFLGDNAIWYTLIMVLLALLALRYKWLTRDGLLAAFIIGVLLLFSPEPMAIIPALVFFGLGSLVSKLPGIKVQKAASRRTAVQVFSNGLAPTLAISLYFVSQNQIWLYAGIAGFAAALSDTLSSELGTRFGGSARDIFSLQKVPKGLSGGVTAVGTVAGLLASFLLAAISSLFLLQPIAWVDVIVIGAIGFVGNLADSVLGSLVQIKYYNAVSEKWEETPGLQDGTKKGLVWMDNNRVNFLATCTACILSLLIFAFAV